jgi:hypothetical protein
VRLKRMASMQDFIRDWRGWTKAERVIASVIIALIVVGTPALLRIDSRFSSR